MILTRGIFSLLGCLLGLGHAHATVGVDAAPVAKVTEGKSTGRALIGGSFSLVDQWGKKRTDRDLRGRWHLVYFGYTFCPDICPMALENMAGALKLLGGKAKNLGIIFITVDPKRDTQEALKSFLRNYDSRIIGLTGSDKQVAQAMAAYRVHGEKVDQDEAENYLMDHSSLIYIMSPRGVYSGALNHESSPDVIVNALKDKL